MSLQAAQEFRSKVNESPLLQDSVRAAFAQQSAEQVVALGREHGHEFTTEDVVELWDAVNETGELSDFELELVSAGGAPSNDPEGLDITTS